MKIADNISGSICTLLLFLLMWSGTTSVHAQSREAITPRETITIFNGEDLTGFYTWLEGGLGYEDPNRVFSVVDNIDGAPAIRVSGEDWGGFVTEQAYSNYHLIVEFRWGGITFGDRKFKAMDSGILLHAEGQDGNTESEFDGAWMRSVEYQLIEGGTGDVILVGGYNESRDFETPAMKASVKQDYNGQFFWSGDGEVREFESGRINWYGRDPDWKDDLGFRGIQDVEKPVGEWNRAEIIADGNTFVYMLNGVVVNKGFDSDLKEGKIMFQSEGAEVFFRRIELRPLK
jgi:hypothetical protein